MTVRSLVAVLAGLVLLIALTTGIDAAILRVYPLPEGMRIGETPMPQVIGSRPLEALLLNFVLRLPALFGATWVTARLAPNHPLRHAAPLAAAAVGVILYGASVAPFPLWSTVSQVVLFPLVTYLAAAAAARSVHQQPSLVHSAAIRSERRV